MNSLTQDPEYNIWKEIKMYDLEHLFITYKKYLNTMEIMKKIANHMFDVDILH